MFSLQQFRKVVQGAYYFSLGKYILYLCWEFCLALFCWYLELLEHLNFCFKSFPLFFSVRKSIRVHPRCGSRCVRACGIFSGATVVRGFDWKWKNQDGKKERGREGRRRRRRRDGATMVSLYYVFYMRPLCRGKKLFGERIKRWWCSIRVCACVCACRHAYACVVVVGACTHVHVCMCACMHMHVYGCACMCVVVGACMHMHVYGCAYMCCSGWCVHACVVVVGACMHVL